MSRKNRNPNFQKNLSFVSINKLGEELFKLVKNEDFGIYEYWKYNANKKKLIFKARQICEERTVEGEWFDVENSDRYICLEYTGEKIVSYKIAQHLNIDLKIVKTCVNYSSKSYTDWYDNGVDHMLTVDVDKLFKCPNSVIG